MLFLNPLAWLWGQDGGSGAEAAASSLCGQEGARRTHISCGIGEGGQPGPLCWEHAHCPLESLGATAPLPPGHYGNQPWDKASPSPQPAKTAYPQLCDLFHITGFEATHPQNRPATRRCHDNVSVDFLHPCSLTDRISMSRGTPFPAFDGAGVFANARLSFLSRWPP